MSHSLQIICTFQMTRIQSFSMVETRLMPPLLERNSPWNDLLKRTMTHYDDFIFEDISVKCLNRGIQSSIVPSLVLFPRFQTLVKNTVGSFSNSSHLLKLNTGWKPSRLEGICVRWRHRSWNIFGTLIKCRIYKLVWIEWTPSTNDQRLKRRS